MAGSSSPKPQAIGLRILAQLIARAERGHEDIEEPGPKEKQHKGDVHLQDKS